MSTKEEKAAKAKEKKEKKLLEQQMKDSQDRCEEGRVLLEPEGKGAQPAYAKAIVAFDAAIELFPDNALAFTYRGVCHRDLGRFDAALDDFSKAFALDPQSTVSLEGRAACYEAQFEWDKAISDYTTILGIHKENDHAHTMRGLCRLRKRAPGLLLKSADFGAVLNDFQRAVQLNENNYYAMVNLGKAYEDQRMFYDAIAAYNKALSVKDDYLYAMYRRGCASLSLVEQHVAKQPANAICALSIPPIRDSNTLDPEEFLRLEQEGENTSKEMKRLLDAAIADFSKVIPPEEKEKELCALVHRGTCYMHLGDFQKAEDEFRFCQKGLQELQSQIQNANENGTPMPPHISPALLTQTLKTKNAFLVLRRGLDRAEKEREKR